MLGSKKKNCVKLWHFTKILVCQISWNSSQTLCKNIFRQPEVKHKYAFAFLELCYVYMLSN